MAKNLRGRFRIPWPVALAAVFAFCFCAAYSYFVFDHAPHIHDEMGYLFQAEIFQAGHLYAPSPCARESFDFPHMINNGKWYSMYTPGFPFLLFIGLLFKAPWLINPLLGGLTVLLLYLLGAQIYDRTTGILAAVLGSVSIWHLLMSSTMMSHTSSMFFNALFLLFFFKSVSRPTARNGILAGAALGMAFLCRPVNAGYFALAFLLAWFYLLIKDVRPRLKNFIALAATGAIFAGLLLVYNQITNGNPFKMGSIVHHGNAYATIFGRPATIDYDYTPLVGAAQIYENLRAINDYLFGWPLSSLFLLLPLFWAARTKPREIKKDLLLLSSFFVMLIGFFFFWGSFIIIGARMLFDSLPILVLLSAKGLRESVRLLSSKFKSIPAAAWRKIVAGVLVAFTLYAFFIRFPHWTRPAYTEWYYKRYDDNLAGASTHIHNAIKSLDIHQAVVIMKFLYAPLTGFPTGWWGSGFLYNTPRLDGDIIYANDVGEKNCELFRCFAGRKFYFYLGTLEKGMLFPLKREGGRIILGDPLLPEKKGRKSVELVAKPARLYKPYSPPFDIFLNELYRDNKPDTIDVNRLMKLGIGYRENRDFQRAAFSFEAALQLEKNPRPRQDLLNGLIPCYLKLGQIREAKIIMDKIRKAEFKEVKIFFVLPERGF